MLALPSNRIRFGKHANASRDATVFIKTSSRIHPSWHFFTTPTIPVRTAWTSANSVPHTMTSLSNINYHNPAYSTFFPNSLSEATSPSTTLCPPPSHPLVQSSLPSVSRWRIELFEPFLSEFSHRWSLVAWSQFKATRDFSKQFLDLSTERNPKIVIGSKFRGQVVDF